jgi:hypothetical protein
MTEQQLKAKRLLKQHHSFLTHQQIRTLNGLIKAGDITGAMNGLHTIMARRKYNLHLRATNQEG